jgi:hypothetical protein
MPAVQVLTAEPATVIVQTTRPSTVTPAGAQLPTQGPLLPWPVHEPQRSAQAGSEPMTQLTPLTRPMQPTSPEPASPRTTGAETPRTRARRVTAREQHKAGISLSPEAEVTTDIPAEPSIPGPITEATGMQTRSRRKLPAIFKKTLPACLTPRAKSPKTRQATRAASQAQEASPSSSLPAPGPSFIPGLPLISGATPSPESAASPEAPQAKRQRRLWKGKGKGKKKATIAEPEEEEDVPQELKEALGIVFQEPEPELTPEEAEARAKLIAEAIPPRPPTPEGEDYDDFA